MIDAHPIVLIQRDVPSAIVIYQMLRDMKVQPDELSRVMAYSITVSGSNKSPRPDFTQCPLDVVWERLLPMEEVTNPLNGVKYVPGATALHVLYAAAYANRRAQAARSTEAIYLYLPTMSENQSSEHTNIFAYSMESILRCMFDRPVRIITPLLYIPKAELATVAEGLGAECQALAAHWAD